MTRVIVSILCVLALTSCETESMYEKCTATQDQNEITNISNSEDIGRAVLLRNLKLLQNSSLDDFKAMNKYMERTGMIADDGSASEQARKFMVSFTASMGICLDCEGDNLLESMQIYGLPDLAEEEPTLDVQAFAKTRGIDSKIRELEEAERYNLLSAHWTLVADYLRKGVQQEAARSAIEICKAQGLEE